MPTLQETIAALSKKLAEEVIGAIRASSLDDILAATRDHEAPALRRAPGRPKGTTTRDLEARRRVRLVVRYFAANPGMSGEDARKIIGFPRESWNDYLSKALAAGKLRQEDVNGSPAYWSK